MSGEQLTGQETPATVYGEVRQPAAAQPNAATADAQTGGAEGGEISQVAPKLYTEEEVHDKIERATAKSAAKAERRAFREARAMLASQSQAQQTANQPSQGDKPTRREGEKDDDYLERLADWKLDQRDSKAKEERAQDQQRSLKQKTDAIYAEAQKVPGFDAEDFDALPLTRQMVEALVDSDQPAKLMAYMAANPAEVERIANLPTTRHGAELGKLEAKVAATPTPRTSKAPNPIKPVGGANTPVTDLASASMDDYIAQRKKQGAAWGRG